MLIRTWGNLELLEVLHPCLQPSLTGLSVVLFIKCVSVSVKFLMANECVLVSALSAGYFHLPDFSPLFHNYSGSHRSDCLLCPAGLGGFIVPEQILCLNSSSSS